MIGGFLLRPPDAKPATARAGGFTLAPSGRAGVRAFCGLSPWPGPRTTPMVRHDQGLSRRRDGPGSRPPLPDTMKLLDPRMCTSDRTASRIRPLSVDFERSSALRARHCGCPGRTPRRRPANTDSTSSGTLPRRHDRRCARQEQPRRATPLGRRRARRRSRSFFPGRAREHVALGTRSLRVEHPVDHRAASQYRHRHRRRSTLADRGRHGGLDHGAERPGQRLGLTPAAGPSADRASLRRTTPTSVETWKFDSAAGARVGSVEGPPMSFRQGASSSSRSREQSRRGTCCTPARRRTARAPARSALAHGGKLRAFAASRTADVGPACAPRRRRSIACASPSRRRHAAPRRTACRVDASSLLTSRSR